MKPRKGREKLVVRFDEEARRDYLTGFQKRKKQRRKKAQRVKLQKAKELLREMKREKQVQIKKKMQQYGLEEKNDDEPETSSRVVHHYPHQVVVVNTQPKFGTTLSSLVNQEGDVSEEEKVATKILTTTQAQHSSKRPSVKDYHSKRTARKNKSVHNTT